MLYAPAGQGNGPHSGSNAEHSHHFLPAELIFMSVDQKIKLVELLAPTGSMYENEKRIIFGLRPLPELEGQRYMSLNWINANNAAQYQVGEVNAEVIDEEKEVI